MNYTNKPFHQIIDFNKPTFVFIANPENPINQIAFEQKSYTGSNDVDFAPIINVSISYNVGNEPDQGFCITNIDDFKDVEEYIESKIKFDIRQLKIEISNFLEDCINFQIKIQTGHQLIDNSYPLKVFQDHISNYNNSKILFSAPFGHGKTTFLNYFFEEKTDDYEVFKVFPVNYSVADNADIFRYIKADILFQLLGKPIEFDFSELTTKEAIEELFYLSPQKTIGLLVKTILSLNKETKYLPELIEKLTPFLKKIEEHKNQRSEDDRKASINYIQEIYENEGSIFEDNFYTQLIRQQLEKLKSNSQKENVLIIEDLDRMDPDHIFRILNVISAHYDTYHLGEEFPYANKFGFDKIIIVCHLKNIQSIFEHRYGRQTDFNGYFDKYFSSKPFEYDNTAMVAMESHKILKNNVNRISSSSIEFEFYLEFINLLVATKLLSLRELLKVKKHKYSRISDNSNKHHSIVGGIGFDFISNLLVILNLEVIETKLNYLNEIEVKSNKFSWNYWTAQLLHPFGSFNKIYSMYTINNLEHPYNGFNYRLESTSGYFAKVVDVSKNDKPIIFKKNDFITLMTFYLDKYFKILEH